MTARVSLFCSASLIAAAIFAIWPAQAVGENDVESGGKSLSRRKNLPWYNSEKDGIKRINVSPDKTDEATKRNSTWLKKNRQAKNRSKPSLSWLAVILNVLIGLGIVLVLAGIIALVIWGLIRGENRRAAKSVSTEKVESQDVDRIQNLPFHVKRPQSDLLAEARRHDEEGNFNEAVIYLYSYQLVQLDKHQRIRLTRGKTNRQYLSEVNDQPTLLDLLQNTMFAFEEVFFGHHSLQRRSFESCWQRLDEFHRLVQGASG